MASILEMTKTALRLKTDDASIIEQINNLLLSGIADLDDTAGIDVGDVSPASNFSTGKDALIAQALITYVRINFGEPDDYDRLYKSYEMQKANLKTAFRHGKITGSGKKIDYVEQVENKPRINNVELVGNKTSHDIKVQDEMDDLSVQEIEKILYLP